MRVGDDDHGADGGARSRRTSPPAPKTDSGIKLGDAAPVIVADGGSCPSGLTDCSNFCVDLKNDPDHCGKCATSCPNDAHGEGVGICVDSRCAFACDPGWVQCAGGCCNTTVTDSGSGEDAGPSGEDASSTVDPGIACAAVYCSVAAQDYCCGGSTSGDICVPSSSSDNCPWEITCSDAAQCGPGTVCCYDNTPNIQQSICQGTCSSGQLQFCNPALSGECTGGQTCTGTFSASGLGTSYSYCE